LSDEPNGFTIDVETRPEMTVISVAGELDLMYAGRVEEHLRESEQVEGRMIVLDLSGLAFIDSTGISVLLRAYLRAQKEGRRLVLLPGPPFVQKVFSVSGMERFFEFWTGDIEDLTAEPDVA
jgi:anti-sigma B factor antagonist